MVTRIVSGWSQQPAGREKRPAGFTIGIVGAMAAAMLLQPISANAAVSGHAGSSVEDTEQAARPNWTGAGNEQAALRLIELLQSSELDGLDPKLFKTKSLLRAVRSADRGDPDSVAKANAMLDRALVAYVTALRAAPRTEWIINDREAIPKAPLSAKLLAEASAAPSLEAWVDAMPFMHQSYAGLRRALASTEAQGDRRSADLLRINLQRVRFLPADGRYVLVNTAAQKLYMYEDGKIVDEMRVVVGKVHQPTPMMAATIKFTALNPYWQVPADLAAERVAPGVVKEGLGYLRQHGYVLLSDWGDEATPIDPSTVDWEAVAAGKTFVRLRQDPGPNNAMGRMKFMFPNPQGIYLHDTPNKELLNEDARLFSGGCVRLEDAPRLAKWIYGEPVSWRGAKTEQPVKLDKPMPVYLIYQTAAASGGQVVFYQDIYGKDRSMLAGSSVNQVAVR